VDEQTLKQVQAERQLELLKRQLFLKMLTKEARSRLANIKMANPEFGAQVEIALIQLIQTGKIARIDEETLITLIKQLKGNVSRGTITRR
jgi:programmed cell death protein 5